MNRSFNSLYLIGALVPAEFSSIRAMSPGLNGFELPTSRDKKRSPYYIKVWAGNSGDEF